MAIPTLAVLVGKLGGGMVPVYPARGALPNAPITGVHVSELPDPTPFVDAGELLLTTGLALGASPGECEVYVKRLTRAGVAALGFGIGPVHDSIPPALIEACTATGPALLEVPEPMPFQEISRAYWHEVGRADQRALAEALTVQGQLVRAAASDQPRDSLLRNLARGVGGWAAHHGPDDTIRAVWPESARERAEEARLGARRVMSGRHSAAALHVAEDAVMVQSVPSGARSAGLLSAGSTSPFTAAQRTLFSTTSVLLGLLAVRARTGRERGRARSEVLARLVEAGETPAALRMAAEWGFRLNRGPMRVLAVTGAPPEDVLELVERALGDETPAGRLIGHATEAGAWFLLPDLEIEEGLAELSTAVRSAEGEYRALAGRPVEAARLPQAIQGLLNDATQLPAGTVRAADATPAPILPARTDAEAWLAPVRGHPELIDALAQYLRHRGRWEAAAQALGLHRNSLRHRINRAARLLEADLEDPDVGARLWLSLRSLGLA